MMDEAFLHDLFEAIAPITIRRMFGGQGIYVDGQICAIVLSSETLCVKGDDISRPAYERVGMTQWLYHNAKTGRDTRMPYWAVPETAFEDPDMMADLARLARATATRARSPERKTARRS